MSTVKSLMSMVVYTKKEEVFIVTVSNVKELIGLELTPYNFGVEAGKIRELANAIGDQNPVYHSLEAAKEAGYEGIPVPLTFLQVIDSFGNEAGFEENMEKLHLNPLRVLHGEQEYEFLAAIYAGDFLSVTSKIVQAESKFGASGGMDIIIQQNQYINQKGVLVALSKSTIIHRH